MKKSIVLFLVLILSITLSACSPSGNTTTETQAETEIIETEAETETEALEETAELEAAWYDTYLHPNKQDLPTSLELKEIEAGMTMDEIHQKIGYPQRIYEKTFAPVDDQSSVPSIIYFIYDSSDGDAISLPYWKTSAGIRVAGEILRCDASELYNIPLDPDKQPLPTYEKLQEISIGMTYQEVYALVGNPQREGMCIMSPNPMISSIVPYEIKCHVYEAQDGRCIYVLFDNTRLDNPKLTVVNVRSST